ncbi:MAG: hypothetical protein KAH18_03630 [Psychromonas sp.]|nr:hypothetical protein [Psychromonas sp.]
MKYKTLMFIAIVVIGVGAYVYKQQDKAKYNVLDYVPADTPIFAGELKPFPIKEYLLSEPQLINPALSEKLEREFKESKTAQKKFFLSLKQTYYDNLNHADKFTTIFGLSKNIRIYFYTLGLIPVFKVEVSNPQAIWSLLDKAEKRSGFTHINHKLKKVNYRSYSLHMIDDINAELIIAINNGFLTVTFNSPYNKPKLLENALGIKKVENSLRDSNVLEDIIKKHGFKGNGVGFINHVEIIKGLTSKNDNQLAQQITVLNNLNSDNSVFNMLRSADCAKDFSSIAKNWPRTVIGYKNISINSAESTFAFSTIVESKNKIILNALSGMQGRIPHDSTKNIDKFIFSIGFGINVAQISHSITTIWQNIQTPKYTCPILADLQKKVEKKSDYLSIISLGANMASGIQGVSFSLMDYVIDTIKNETRLKNLDFLFSISANDPEKLYNSIKMKIPELKTINLKNNGPAVDIGYLYPELLDNNTKPKLVIKGKHIIAYAGKKSTVIVNDLAKKTRTEDGLYNMSFNLKRMVEPIIKDSKLADKLIPEELMFITGHDVRVKESFKVTSQGFVLDSYINNKFKNN